METEGAEMFRCCREACRIGTQPKGIGDRITSVFASSIASRLPDRHTAERHWRRSHSRTQTQNGIRSCRIGTQPKGIGDCETLILIPQFVFVLPDRHTAERHWRPRLAGAAIGQGAEAAG